VVPRGAQDGFHWNWRQKKYDNDTERQEVADKVIAKLKV
jgi:hypothetical protein